MEGSWEGSSPLSRLAVQGLRGAVRGGQRMRVGRDGAALSVFLAVAACSTS